jgi:type IV pilus biogenesis protein PilP
MQNNLCSLLLLSFALASNAACAESTSDSLTRIEEETLILKAKEKQLDIQAKIASKRSEIAAKQAEADRLVRTASADDPVIRSVEGIGATVYATLQFSNGTTVDAKEGDVLQNGMRVISIHPNEVIVQTQKKKRIRLAAGSFASTPYSPAYPNGVMAMPPLPPMSPSRGADK